nr:hypothetical protein [Mycoplasmopsis bovis]
MIACKSVFTDMLLKRLNVRVRLICHYVIDETIGWNIAKSIQNQ